MAKAIFLTILVLFSNLAEGSILGGELHAPSSVHRLIKQKLDQEYAFTVEVGFEYLHPNFPSIQNIVVENPRTSTVNTPQTGSVPSDYPDVFAQTFKLQALLDRSKTWTVSLKTYLPLNAMAQVDTGYIYQPEFVLYRAEAQRPRVLIASGLNLSEDWRVGMAADLGFAVTAQANVFLQSGANTYSDQRLTAKLKPTLVPQLSVQFRDYTFAVRGENKSDFNLSTAAGARVFGSVNAGINYSYTSGSAAYFQPWDFELSGRTLLSDTVTLIWSGSYQLWSGYRARAALIENEVQNNCSDPSCASQFSPSLAPDSKGRNLFVPAVAFEFQSGDPTYSLGYRFKDSIFENPPRGNGNYLDPPRHDLLLGATFPTKGHWTWSVNLQVSRLASVDVVKLDSGEIGAPGYVASGWMYGGGINVAIPFQY